MYRSYHRHSMESSGHATASSVSPVYGICRRRTNYILGAGIMLALIGASLLVAFGLLYVDPYVRVRHLVEAQCTTVQTTRAAEKVPCTCASDGSGSCTSFYPCLHIAVNYTTATASSRGREEGGGGVDVAMDVANATLYDSYETFTIQNSAQFVRQVPLGIVGE